MLEFIIKYWMEWGFGIVAGGLTLAYRRLSKKVKEQKDENKAMKDGLKAILHDRLYQSCNYYIARGWIDTVGLSSSKQQVLSLKRVHVAAKTFNRI